jgi:hypothetical protein
MPPLLEITENGLTPVYYLSVHCRHCGDFRIGTNQEPSDLYPCPICQRSCEAVLLGEGGTVRPLPFWDRTEGKGVYREMLERMLLARRKRRLAASA